MSLKEKYINSVLPSLVKEFKFSSSMRAPKITKVVINMGLGEAVNDKKILDFATADLMAIAGQKPLITKAKKSISGFKIREGYPIGCKVTLRKNNMWTFLNKLVNISLPRIRDFRGISSKSFDKFGNYSFGVKEQIIFPEIDFGKIDKIRGMSITIVTTAKTNEEGIFLLKNLGFPLV